MHEVADQVRAVRSAARDATVVAELEAVYAQVRAEVAARGPACWASGRCCNFRQAGHDLFVTLLEAAYCVDRAAAVGAHEGRRHGAEDSGAASASGIALPQLDTPPLRLGVTGADVDAARTRGDCPFLAGNLCMAHEHKPLGCRVYFCDASAQEWQRDLTERMLARLRALHEAHGIPYLYDEWRNQLARVVSA